MAGPLSAPAGARRDGGKTPHEKCQDRGQCAGPGCRVSTGKTYHKRTGAPSARTQAELAKLRADIAGRPDNDDQEAVA